MVYNAGTSKTSINVDFVEPPLLCQTKEHLWRGSRMHPARKKAC